MPRGKLPAVVSAFGITMNTQEWSDKIGVARKTFLCMKSIKKSYENVIAFYATWPGDEIYFLDDDELREEILSKIPADRKGMIESAKRSPSAVFCLKQYSHRVTEKMMREAHFNRRLEAC